MSYASPTPIVRLNPLTSISERCFPSLNHLGELRRKVLQVLSRSQRPLVDRHQNRIAGTKTKPSPAKRAPTRDKSQTSKKPETTAGTKKILLLLLLLKQER